MQLNDLPNIYYNELKEYRDKYNIECTGCLSDINGFLRMEQLQGAFNAKLSQNGSLRVY